MLLSSLADVTVWDICVRSGFWEPDGVLWKLEVGLAVEILRCLVHSHGSHELRMAMESGDIERLRVTVTAAINAGLIGAEVDSAWEQIRPLEANSWLKRQLQSAFASADAVRLQAAIKQAAMVGVSSVEADTARVQLHALCAYFMPSRTCNWLEQAVCCRSFLPIFGQPRRRV